MPWHQVVFSEEQVREGMQDALVNAFSEVFISSHALKGVGMFAKDDVSAHVFYFSPKAVEIAGDLIRFYGGTECSAPSPDVVGVVFDEAQLSSIPFVDA